MTERIATAKNEKKEEKNKEDKTGKEKKENWLNNYWHMHTYI